MLLKNNILESWIFVEQLSEGDVNLKDRKLKDFKELKERNYHEILKKALYKEKSKRGNSTNLGLIIFFGIFEFEDVVRFLRKEFKIKKTNEDIRYGNKFSFILCFDKDLNLDSDKTFYNMNRYILDVEKIPKLKEFKDYEDDFKNEMAKYFEDVKNEHDFNDIFDKILNSKRIKIDDVKFKVLRNIETEAENLHSFFVKDLERAKKLKNENLDTYLLGSKGERRINLDTRKESPNFNPNEVKNILMPFRYPNGRFPSNTDYALSLMQQVAVNIIISGERMNIQSVNGPPGTGKTTLLKDVFADLITSQAREMSKLEKRGKQQLKGDETTIYYKNASIAELPESISSKEIVVTSSNNGAVQNIVNELPLIKDIDEDIRERLMKADYFFKLANSEVKEEWREDDEGKKKKELKTEEIDQKYWGLFSLEGGKSSNMNTILNYIELILKYFEDYEGNPKIYKKFSREYQNLEEMKKRTHDMMIKRNEYLKIKGEIRELEDDYSKNIEQKRKESEEIILREQTASRELKAKLKELEGERTGISEQRKDLGLGIQNISSIIDDRRPKSLIARLFASIKSDPKLKKLISEKERLVMSDNAYREEENKIRKNIKEIEKKIDASEKKIGKEKKKFANWESEIKEKLQNKNKKLRELNVDNGFKSLDMNEDYRTLQLTNPYFDKEFRIAQSNLFVLALEVRKQFLYENRKNLKAAMIIWKKQRDYIETKHLIEIAWHWINLAIPVISSTFASFSKMFNNIGENSIGYLFVDEAGQALPQAAVGSVFRSKNQILVGDPSQIKPVLTLDTAVLSLLCKKFKLGKEYLSDSASAQTLADNASVYGFYKEGEKSESSWIGIPLWVHRRCQYPMFTISNEISYNGLMVQGVEKKGKTGWYDVGGKAKDKYVEEQAELLLRKIQKIKEEDSEKEEKEKREIYVISPFRNVAARLTKKLEKIKFIKSENGKATNVGTIHTFQGKEAAVVFLMLGADDKSKGAAAWAVSEANMMNVAATRAKKEFYIIGDKKLYSNLGSYVAETTISIIDEYGKENPDLVDENSDLSEVNTEERREVIEKCSDFSGQGRKPEEFNFEEEKTNIAEGESESKSPSAKSPKERANSDMICDKCDEKMVIRDGKFGKFWGCSGYPKCKNTKSIKIDRKVQIVDTE